MVTITPRRTEMSRARERNWLRVSIAACSPWAAMNWVKPHRSTKAKARSTRAMVSATSPCSRHPGGRSRPDGAAAGTVGRSLQRSGLGAPTGHSHPTRSWPRGSVGPEAVVRHLLGVCVGMPRSSSRSPVHHPNTRTSATDDISPGSDGVPPLAVRSTGPVVRGDRPAVPTPRAARRPGHGACSSGACRASRAETPRRRRRRAAP